VGPKVLKWSEHMRDVTTSPKKGGSSVLGGTSESGGVIQNEGGSYRVKARRRGANQSVGEKLPAYRRSLLHGGMP